MVELVDTVVLEATASASEFESRLGHHIKTHSLDAASSSGYADPATVRVSVFLYGFGGLASLE